MQFQILWIVVYSDVAETKLKNKQTKKLHPTGIRIQAIWAKIGSEKVAKWNEIKWHEIDQKVVASKTEHKFVWKDNTNT